MSNFCASVQFQIPLQTVLKLTSVCPILVYTELVKISWIPTTVIVLLATLALIVRLKSTSAIQILVYMDSKLLTLKCLNIGTPKTINFPFVPNGK